MAARRYDISRPPVRVEKYFTGERDERVKYFSTLEEKCRVSARSCNVLFII